MTAIRIILVLTLLCIVSSAFAAAYQDPQGRFAFEVPSGWKAIAAGDDGATVSDGAAAYARIVHVPGAGKDMRLVKRVSDQIGMQWQAFKQGEHGEVKFAGRQGIYVFYSGINPKGVQALMRIVTAPVGEDAYMLIMSCPTADLDTSKDSLLAIEHSFKIPAAGEASPRKTTPGALPTHAVPAGLEDHEGPNGERILTGQVGSVSSGAATFKAGLNRTRGYFEGSPKMLSVVQSKDSNVMMATFSASLHHTQVIVMAIATYDPNGQSRFSMLIDTPERFTKSLTSMLKHVHDITNAAIDKARPAAGNDSIDFASFEKAAHKVSLSHTSFPDGSATIGIAPGFTPQNMSAGQFHASNPEGSYANLFMPIPMLDPKGDLYQRILGISGGGRTDPALFPGQAIVSYNPHPGDAWAAFLSINARQHNVSDPAPHILTREPLTGVAKGWTGELVTGTMTLLGKKVVFTGSILASPPPGRDGGWMIQVSILGAPADHAAADMPALIAMQRSEKVDMEKMQLITMRNIAIIQERTTQWLAKNQAQYDQASHERYVNSQRIAAANREALDKSTAGFIDYISDRAVVTTPGGGSLKLEKNFASALEQADPQHFTILKASEYIPGRDY